MVTTFDWTTHPEAEALVGEMVAEALTASPRVRTLADRLRGETSTRLTDWLDHVAASIDAAALRAAGFVDGHATVAGVWRHPGAQLPAVVPSPRLALALRVDDAGAFGAAHGGGAVEGSQLSGYRRAEVSGAGEAVAVAGVERRSWGCGTEAEILPDPDLGRSLRAWAMWSDRPRTMEGAAGVRVVAATARAMVDLVGPDRAASYAMESERRYWQRRNTAAAVQHARQDRLGLGWGNHDHHTFRSSRPAFRPLIEVLQELGFGLRERFYAGDEAGWGAQVLEHPGAGLVVFADVDLGPAEVAVDFAAADLGPAPQLGTVGLWCALHGESLLAAGMHHLEGQFDFDRLRDDLGALGVGQMRPFSDLPHLRQAFTEAERWPVDGRRLEALVAAGHITREQADGFAAHGAAGSHLENLARGGGFKGFNQHNVSTTMRATDPRLLGAR